MLNESYKIASTRYLRYKYIRVAQQDYLIDLDANKLIWFLPFLIWLRPLTVYKVESISELKKSRKSKSKGSMGLIVAMTSIFSAILIRLIPENFSSLVFIDDTVVTIFLMLAILFVSYLIRLGFSKKIPMKGGKSFKMTCSYAPDTVRQYYIQKTYGFLGAFIIYFIFVYWFVEKGNPYIGVLLIVLTLTYFFLNTLIVPIQLEKVSIEINEEAEGRV